MSIASPALLDGGAAAARDPRCAAPPDGYAVAMLLQALVCSRCATTEVAGAAAFANGFWETLAVLVLPLLFVTAVGALLWRMPLGLGERPL